MKNNWKVEAMKEKLNYLNLLDEFTEEQIEELSYGIEGGLWMKYFNPTFTQEQMATLRKIYKYLDNDGDMYLTPDLDILVYNPASNISLLELKNYDWENKPLINGLFVPKEFDKEIFKNLKSIEIIDIGKFYSRIIFEDIDTPLITQVPIRADNKLENHTYLLLPVDTDKSKKILVPNYFGGDIDIKGLDENIFIINEIKIPFIGIDISNEYNSLPKSYETHTESYFACDDIQLYHYTHNTYLPHSTLPYGLNPYINNNMGAPYIAGSMINNGMGCINMGDINYKIAPLNINPIFNKFMKK